MTPEFKGWPKTPRLHKPVVITEKIDGTNAAVIVYEDEAGRLQVGAQSRKRIITPGKDTDNYGFAAWVAEHEDQLVNLGLGYHYGEWYGKGIQHGYGLEERRFALFNPDTADVPACCDLVPVLWRGGGDELNDAVERACQVLRITGSFAPGVVADPETGRTPDAEGIIVYHTAARAGFKVLLEGDDTPKGAR